MSFCPNKSHPNWKELVEKVGEDKAYEEYILNGFKLLSQKEIKQLNPNINYTFKSVINIFKNIDKVNILFKKIGNTDTFWNKIQQDLQIPKEQIKLLKESEGNNIEDKLISFVANYSYTVEINTAKANFKRKSIDQITGEEFIDDSEATGENAQYYSNLTVPGGTNYTENEIATPDITPSIKGHAQFATDNGIGWFRSDEQTIGGELYHRMEDAELMSRGGKKTKTRRILEVQSDWGQKQRKSAEPDINIKYDIQQIINDLQKSGDLKIDCN